MPFDRETTDEAEFERRLLAAARGDAGPPDVAGAWAKLAGALGPIVSDPALGGWPRATGGAAVAPAAIRTGGARLVRAAAMKWMLLGALAGSAATVAILVRSRTGPSDVRPPAVSRPAATAAEATGAPPAQAARAPEPLASRESSASLHGVRAKRAGDARARALQQPVGRGDSAGEASGSLAAGSSALAAEVARLDAARTSNAIGDYDGTVRLIERYHRDFPNGALAPDADVVALEAVAAKRDHAETARRAALFLSRYPGDPHAARVKWLAEH
ncbi:MAG TPA: hypothetical protein VI456_06540 [Polyangia bacterium]